MTENQLFVAKTYAGLEEVLANELTQLGAENIEVLTRAVEFMGDKKLMYAANYNCRTALRVLKSLHRFQLASEDDLYTQVFQFPWEDYFSISQTLAVDAVVYDSELTHSHFVALRTKDAICDRFREKNNGRRPSVDIDNPDMRVHVHISHNTCDILFDSSGESLHKRGYRVASAEAPLSEVLAAGLILLSGWKKNCQFIDPMCGSGTLLIEAALIANNMPCGMYRREYGFMYWNDFDKELFDKVKSEAFDKQTEFEHEIVGYDISSKNLSAAKANVKAAKLHKDIKLQVSDFQEFTPDFEQPGLVITNPPYGERIKSDDIVGLYRSFGDTLKKDFQNYTIWVISGDFFALKNIGLKPSQKINLWNGPLECKVLKFELYQGSKKGKYLDKESTDSEEKLPYIKKEKTTLENEKIFSERKAESISKAKREYLESSDSEDKPSRREKQDFRKNFFSDQEPPRSFDKKDDRPFSDRKPRSFDRKDDRPFSDRKPRSFDRKDDRPFSDRKPRSFDRKDDRPFSDRKPSSFDRKDDRPFSDRKPSSFDRKDDRPFSDRKPSSFDRKDDRPFSDRKPSSFDRKDDRPFRDRKPSSFDRKDDRPFSDRKPSSFDRKDDRPFRDRKPSSFDRKDDRPFSDRKPSSFDRKDDRPFSDRKPSSFDRKDDRPFRDRKPSSFDRKDDRPFRDRKPNSFDRKDDRPFSDRKPSSFDRKDDRPFSDRKPSSFDRKDDRPFSERKPRRTENERKPFHERPSLDRMPLAGEKQYIDNKPEKKQRPRTKK